MIPQNVSFVCFLYILISSYIYTFKISHKLHDSERNLEKLFIYNGYTKRQMRYYHFSYIDRHRRKKKQHWRWKKPSILNLSLILIKVLLCVKRQHNISLTLSSIMSSFYFISVCCTVLLPKKVWRHYDDVTHSQNGSCWWNEIIIFLLFADFFTHRTREMVKNFKSCFYYWNF